MISEGSTEFSNNYEREYRSKRRPQVRLNWRKRSAPSLDLGTRKMTRREAADESGRWAMQSSVNLSSLSSSSELLTTLILTPNNLLYLKSALLRLYQFHLKLRPPPHHCYIKACFL
ncbi:hypothetical protein NPIL_245051 [Nephila pilipes]|uniref:Uncharacterized protein n=1 Tax=Nephila pilipes TaxID=299642 RepID=A0A8X6P4D8_NEPPI|nr:hypothetical protein NPIL_245051 [Nephila pilipes]